MPRGPKGEKRPAGNIGNAVMIAKIATGEIDDLNSIIPTAFWQPFLLFLSGA